MTLTLKIEILKEHAADFLTRFYRYQKQMEIKIDDEGSLWILISDDLSYLIHTKIHFKTTFREIERYTEYIEGIERTLNRCGKTM
ncbi:hypothetical protein [Streptococcus sp. HMSC077D04]|uniref:hypothetical protein n=1 Tax=Streptococcus sp. HMSC077D04 TaxID=1715180 RepID=UPI0008A18DE0|nr:hypothetical protein HMPREF2701_01755 [Streptococcus sp. HMSC077D04]HEV6150803.1 transcriptional regulator [Streptococcus pneumoniae]HEV6241166.1 transcriptional regulator [Streptococcus pneumoniae]HEV6256857.1 transcriptional regulator [Streptococcus pneumoniae]HEV6274781.1 transcriptional regulator [Streptococcus pneumoniae]